MKIKKKYRIALGTAIIGGLFAVVAYWRFPGDAAIWIPAVTFGLPLLLSAFWREDELSAAAMYRTCAISAPTILVINYIILIAFIKVNGYYGGSLAFVRWGDTTCALLSMALLFYAVAIPIYASRRLPRWCLPLFYILMSILSGMLTCLIGELFSGDGAVLVFTLSLYFSASAMITLGISAAIFALSVIMCLSHDRKRACAE